MLRQNAQTMHKPLLFHYAKFLAKQTKTHTILKALLFLFSQLASLTFHSSAFLY